MFVLFQIHEQQNKVIKGDGGPMGLYKDEKALEDFGVRAPEVTRLVAEFESGITNNTIWNAEYNTSYTIVPFLYYAFFV